MSDDRAVTLAELARALGVRPSYVSALKRAGRLVMADDGKRALLEASRARIAETRDPAKAAVAARHAQARGAAVDTGATTTDPTPPADDDGETPADATGADYQVWRARRERAVALREERANMIEAGKLMPIEQVAEDVRIIAAQLRQTLETQLDAVIPRLVGLLTEDDVRRVIAPEYHEALDRAATDLQNLAKAKA